MDKKTSFVVIQDWMLDLDLDLTETVIFAVIWGFSQDGESRFRGSWRYLQNTAKCSRAKVSRSLKMLVENGYVKKVDKVTGGVKLCEYYIETGGITERRVVSLGDGEVVSQGDGGGISARPNNKEYNGDTIVSPNRENRGRALEEDDDPFAMPPFDEVEDPTPSPKPSPSPKTATRFTPPTLEEVAAYCRERGNKIDPQHFVNYYTSNGWMVGKNKMKDWRAAVRNWETRDKERNNGKRNIDPGSPAAYRQVGRGDYYGESTI